MERASRRRQSVPMNVTFRAKEHWDVSMHCVRLHLFEFEVDVVLQFFHSDHKDNNERVQKSRLGNRTSSNRAIRALFYPKIVRASGSRLLGWELRSLARYIFRIPSSAFNLSGGSNGYQGCCKAGMITRSALPRVSKSTRYLVKKRER